LAFGGLIGLFIAFSLASPYFLTFDNIIGILLATTVNGVLALGATFVIITAGIDLSVGTVMTLSAVIAAVLITELGLPIPLGLLGAIVTGALAGLINGVTISRMKVPPFVATLGVMMGAKGLSLVISHSRPIYFTATPAVRGLTMDSVIGSLLPGADVPNAVFFLFGAAIIASLILGKTILGTYAFAIGSNEEAARLSGVNVNFWKAAVYVLCGVFSGLAGIIIGLSLGFRAAGIGGGLRTRRDRGGRHRGHVTQWWGRHDSRHDYRCLHHQRPDQRATDPFGCARVADSRDRRDRDYSCLC
jgi:ribose transport system permease protein